MSGSSLPKTTYQYSAVAWTAFVKRAIASENLICAALGEDWWGERLAGPYPRREIYIVSTEVWESHNERGSRAER